MVAIHSVRVGGATREMAPARILAHVGPVVSLILAPLPYQQRRALKLLAGSAKQGCTEAFLLAHGFTVELPADMVRAGLATAQIERAYFGGQTRVHITDAGRRALRTKRTQ